MKKSNIIILIVSILVFLAASGFLIKPMMSEIKDYESQKESIGISILNFKSIKEKLSQQKRIQLNADLDKMQETLPEDPGIPDLLVQIQALAASSGVAVSNFSFSLADNKSGSLLSASDANLSGKAQEGFPKLGINLSVSGVYSSIKSFMRTVENNIRIMDIISLRITGPKSDSSEMSANLEIATYYKENKEK